MITRRKFGLALGSMVFYPFLVASPSIGASNRKIINVFKSPWCGCCGSWVNHLKANGFETRVTEMEDVNPIKNQYKIPENLRSCHTALMDGYVVEGHVPSDDIQRLILERPDARGLSVPGMPIGSPGMDQGPQKDPFYVVLFKDGLAEIFSRHNGA